MKRTHFAARAAAATARLADFAGIDVEGRVAAVSGLAVEVEGLPVRSTALVNAWATAESDIERTLNGTPIRRVIEVDVAEGQVRRLLLWVDPVSRDQVLLGVHPLDG